jgi:hypothetical protein
VVAVLMQAGTNPACCSPAASMERVEPGAQLGRGIRRDRVRGFIGPERDAEVERARRRAPATTSPDSNSNASMA